MNSIGIIGAGNIGQAFARTLARTVSRPPSPTAAARRHWPIVAAIGPSIKAGTLQEAAAKDIVLVAVNWSKLPAALRRPARLERAHRLDANNSIEAPLFKPVDLAGRASRARCSRRSRAWSPGREGPSTICCQSSWPRTRRAGGRQARAVRFGGRRAGEGRNRRADRQAWLPRHRSRPAGARRSPRPVPGPCVAGPQSRPLRIYNAPGLASAC